MYRTAFRSGLIAIFFISVGAISHYIVTSTQAAPSALVATIALLIFWAAVRVSDPR